MVLMALVGVAIPCACAGQDSERPKTEGPPKLARELGALSVSLLDEAEDSKGVHFGFKVHDTRDGRQHRFTVDDRYIGRIDEIVNHANKRLVLLGSSTAGRGVIIVDVAKGEVLDSFWCYSPSVSADGTFIAYRRFQQRTAPSHTDVYLVYDVSKSALENRPERDIQDRQNVGWPVFPRANVTRRAYLAADSYSPIDGVHHGLGSELTWVGRDLLAFVDLAEQQGRLVVVDLARGIASPWIAETILDPEELVDTRKLDHPGSASAFIRPEVLKRVPGDELRLRLGFRYRPELRVSWLDVVVAPEKFAPVPPADKR